MSISKEAVQYLFPHVFSADPAVDRVKNPFHTTVCPWIFPCHRQDHARKSAHNFYADRF